MLDYISSILLRFQYPSPSRNQHSLYMWKRPQYGATQQFAKKEDTTDKLPPSGILRVQKIISSLLYYALAVDCTLLIALGDLASAQSTVSEDTWDAIVWILNYAATHLDANITYNASDMCLHAHSNASYLSAPKARSRAGGYFS